MSEYFKPGSICVGRASRILYEILGGGTVTQITTSTTYRSGERRRGVAQRLLELADADEMRRIPPDYEFQHPDNQWLNERPPSERSEAINTNTNTATKENTTMFINKSHDRIRSLVQQIQDELLQERERAHVEAVTDHYTKMVESAEAGDVIRAMTDGDTPDIIWWGLHTDGKWYRFDYDKEWTSSEFLISDLVARSFDGEIVMLVEKKGGKK